MRTTKLAACFTAAALLFAACGSDEEDTTPATSTPGTSAVATTAAAAGTTAAPTTASPSEATTGETTAESTAAPAPATGEPIHFVLISGTGPGTTGVDAVPGAEAAVEAVNAAGGVNGRPLEMTFCDTKGDPNLAGDCAREAVADESILATVGNTLYAGGEQINPVLEEAQMAAVATRAFAPADYESPVVFTIDAGGLAAIPASNAIMASRGLRNIVTASFDVPAAHAGFQFINDTVVPSFEGMETRFVGIPPTATDINAYVAEAIRGNPEGIHIGATKAMAISFINGARSQGYTGTMTVPASVMTPQDLSEQLTDAEGELLLPATVSHRSEGWAQFEAEMTEHRPDAAANETAVLAWIGVHQFADVLETIEGELTREAVLDAFNSVEDYSTNGLLPALTYTTPNPAEGYSRLFNPTVAALQWKDGELTDADPGKFVNLFTGEVVESS